MYLHPIRIWGFFWSDSSWKQVYLLHCLLLCMHQKGYFMDNLDEARAYVHIDTRLCCFCITKIACWRPCAGHDHCKQNTCMLFPYVSVKHMHSVCASAAWNGYTFVSQAYAFCMCKCVHISGGMVSQTYAFSMCKYCLQSVHISRGMVSEAYAFGMCKRC